MSNQDDSCICHATCDLDYWQLIPEGQNLSVPQFSSGSGNYRIVSVPEVMEQRMKDTGAF